ncbi:methanol O-anthraniloyltransferase-like [Malania oleifera]|uniref:methanol O-anthraniloyltransferase-like n=1 Tax=Malania oleifera TaxID=397392 RepID=UPI0025AE1AB9|nr:methanol O-anthraniloyltransferase-like [Malania oleifera]
MARLVAVTSGLKMVTSTLPVSFSVRRREPELIEPAKSTPRELKPLSDIDDQEGLREHIPGIIIYRNVKTPSSEGIILRDPARVVREALAAALVFYYPIAGRVVEGPDRKLMVDCTSEGVLFIEADADVALDDLGDAIMPPCPNLEELLYNVPRSDGIIGCPLLLVQVTRLKCGGFIFGFRFNHTICDGLGFSQFLNAIGEIARGARAPSLLPVWHREILNARNPPRITCTHYEYEEVHGQKNVLIDWASNVSMVHASFFFGPNEIRALKKSLPPRLSSHTSTYEVLAACLWRCRTIALELHPSEKVRFSSMVSVCGKGLIDVPTGYYGNAFVYPAVVSTTQLLCENPLEFAVELVKKVKTQVSEEYVRSVVDLMVMKGRPMYTMESMYMISDTRFLGLEEVDLGWGKPIYSGPAKAVSTTSFCVGFKNSKGEKGIVVSICLPLEVMNRFQEELKKMTQESSHDVPQFCWKKASSRL